MDLTLDVENYKLNIRAAGIIIHDNKVLTHKTINKDHYCLPGGRVEIGESSEQTIKREIQEELGKKVEILGYVATIENFFEMENKKYHEIYFLYRIEFADEEDKKINYTMHNSEGKEYLRYEWIEVDKIDECNLLPKCLKDIVKSKKFPIHKINDELRDKDILIRKVKYEDIEQIVDINIKDWKKVYKGIIDAEIIAIYVDCDKLGNGVGRKLVEYVKADLKNKNKNKMVIWCLEKNKNARKFYEKMGGKLLDGERFFEVEGKKYKEVGYIYGLERILQM